MPAQEQLNKAAVKEIQGWRNTAAQLWLKACEFDQIAPDAKFAVFSPENKFAQFYNIAIKNMWDARQQYAKRRFRNRLDNGIGNG